MEKADEIFLNFSWHDRRQLAVCSWVQGLQDGYGRMPSYEIASVATRVHSSTVRDWVREWLKDDGFFTAANWGSHDYVPTYLADEDIANACREWWRDRRPKKGFLLPLHSSPA